MTVTKKELARLVRVARSAGYFATHGDERNAWSFPCPAHKEAMIRAGVRQIDGIRQHYFPVHHLPWEHSPTVALVTKALASHLEDAEVNEEPCDRLV
jgi:hypothetical protein